MPLIFNGSEPENITYNGNEVKKVIYNGNVVWEKKLSETYTIFFQASGDSDLTTLLVSGLDGNLDFQTITPSQRYTAYTDIDVLIKSSLESYTIALYITDNTGGGVIGYFRTNDMLKFGESFQIEAGHVYRVATNITTN